VSGKTIADSKGSNIRWVTCFCSLQIRPSSIAGFQKSSSIRQPALRAYPGGLPQHKLNLAIALTTLATSISALSYQKLKARFTFTNLYSIAFLFMGVGYLIINAASSYAIVLPVALWGRILGGLTTSFFLGQFISPLMSQPLSLRVGLGVTYGLAGANAGHGDRQRWCHCAAAVRLENMN
jgi:hypothetical protein